MREVIAEVCGLSDTRCTDQHSCWSKFKISTHTLNRAAPTSTSPGAAQGTSLEGAGTRRDVLGRVDDCSGMP